MKKQRGDAACPNDDQILLLLFLVHASWLQLALLMMHGCWWRVHFDDGTGSHHTMHKLSNTQVSYLRVLDVCGRGLLCDSVCCGSKQRMLHSCLWGVNCL